MIYNSSTCRIHFLIFRHPKSSSPSPFFLSKRFVSKDLVKTFAGVYNKGVTGSFTLADKMYDQIYKYPIAFKYHLFESLNFYNTTWNKVNFTQQLFDRSFYSVNPSHLQNDCRIAHFGILGETGKPFGHVLSFNQNFLSHRFHKHYFDPKQITYQKISL